MKMKNCGIVLLLITNVFCCPMDDPEVVVETPSEVGALTVGEYVRLIGAKIDKKLLGVDPRSFTTSYLGTELVGLCASIMRYFSQTDQEIVKDLYAIQPIMERFDEKYGMPQDKLFSIFQRLEQEHKYFYLAVKRTIKDRLMQLDSVNGSTLDNIASRYCKEFDSVEDVREYIFKVCHDKYKKNMNLTGSLQWFNFNEEDDIHVIPLHSYGNDDLSDNLLQMSSDSTYLKSSDKSKKEIVWNMATAKVVNCDDQQVEWKQADLDERYSRGFMLSENDTYLVADTSRFLGMYVDHDPIQIIALRESTKVNGHSITLFKRPTIASSLCQKAFLNSRGDVEKLIALRNSRAVADLKTTEGFVGRNLDNLITVELNQLG